MITSRADAVANFNTVKDSIRRQAESGEGVKVQGDKYEVTDSFRASLPAGDFIVHKGSAFDSDLKTRDTVSVFSSKDGVDSLYSFEHYGKKKWFTTDERLTLNSTVYSQGPGGFSTSNSSVDFSI